MLRSKELIIATRKYAREDRKKSWWCLISTIVLFLAAYIGAIVNFHIALQIICSLLAVVLIVRLFILYHDYLHKAILQQSLFAEVFFTLYGMFILAPISIWRRSHDFHHAHNSKLYTSSIGSFPLVTKDEYLAASKLDRTLYLMSRHPLTIAFGYLFVFFWGMSIRSLLNNRKKHLDSLFGILFHVSLGATIYFFFGIQSFLLGFMLPAALSSAIGSYLFYAQHNFPAATYRPKEEWDYVYAALHSSSYMKMNGLMRWFTGNIGYHHIHHINSSIPFYNLPIVYREMPEFQNPGTTSLRIRDIYGCFRVKVWDPARGKMIGLREIHNT